MKKVAFVFLCLWSWAAVIPANAAQFEFHGDMNHRFLLYTDRHDWLEPEQQGTINNDNVSESYGELKYRFWFEAADDEEDIKGVYAIEIGGIRFGRSGSGKSQGGSFSGDAVNLETRWAYLDFQTPGVDRHSRWRMGLMPVKINSYLWQETATGIDYNGFGNETISYQLAWIRSIDKLTRTEDDDDAQDVDSFYGRLNFKPREELKIGLFGLYTFGDNNPDDASGFADVTPRDYLYKKFADEAESNFWSVGLDGSCSIAAFTVNWDLIYQGGELNDISFDDSEFSGEAGSGDFDLNAYFLHFDVGYKMGDTNFIYTFWYASGDDDADDDDFNGYLAYDLDREDNMTLFEGPYPDDVSYFTERPYMLDKGFVMNKLAVDHKFSPKLTLGAAIMYMLTSEDIEYTDADGDNQESTQIGFEINGWAKYMLFPRCEFAINAGYLFAGEAMDAFETGSQRDGSADENIFVSAARIRYKF